MLPVGARTDRPDYDYLDGLTLRVFPGAPGTTSTVVTTPEGATATFTIERTDAAVSVTSDLASGWSVALGAVGEATQASDGAVSVRLR